VYARTRFPAALDHKLIAPEVHCCPRILEPFYTTKPMAGVPAGLDICWRIVVQRHRGDLRFALIPGDIRFQVMLPLIQNG
jgi:hypothetical protein